MQVTVQSINNQLSFTELAEQASDVWLVFDAGLKSIFVNHAIFSVLGYTPDEIIGTGLIPGDPVTTEMIRSSICAAIKNNTKNIPALISWHPHRDTRKEIWFQSTITCYYQNEGFQYGIITARDITVSKKGEESLTRIKNDLQESQKLAKLGTWDFDVIKDTQMWSEGQCFLYEVDPGEEPRTFEQYLEFVFQEDREIFTAGLASLRQGKKDEVRHTYRIRTRRTKTKKVIQSTITPYYENGQLVRIKGINQDITESVRRENTLLDLNSNLIESQRLAKLGGWELDIRNKRIKCLDGEKLHCEIDKAPETLDIYLQYVHPDDRHIFEWNNPLFVTGVKSGISVDYRIVTPSGKVKTIQALILPIYHDNTLIKLKGITQDITHLAQRENELKAVNERLSQSQDMAGLGNWDYDVIANKQTWSTGELNIYELNEEDIPTTFESYLQYIHPDDRNTFLVQFESLKVGMPARLSREFRIITKTGHIKYVRSVVEPEYKNGNLVKLKGITLDITRDRQYQYEISQSNEQFKLLFDTMNQGVIMIDLQGVIMNANAAAEKIIGIKKGQMNGSSIFTVDQGWNIIREDGTRLSPQEFPASLSLRTGEVVNGFTVGILNPTFHEYRWLMVNSMVVTTSTNSDRAFVYVTLEDITAQRKSYELLKQSEQKFADAFKYSGTGMTLSYLDGRFAEVNKALCDIVGYSREELLALDFQAITYPEDLQVDLDNVQKLLAGETDSYQLEKRYIHKKGHIVWVILTVSLIKENGNVKYFIGQIQDVTRLKTEQSLRLENEEKFIALVENAFMGVEISKGDEVVYANPRLLELFGCKSLQELSSEMYYEKATVETKKILRDRRNALKKGLVNRETFIGSFHVSPDSVKIFEIQSKPILLHGEKYEMSVVLDITEKLMSQQALEDTNRVFSHAQKFAHLGSWRWTIHTGELYWSDSIFTLFGFNKQKDKVTYENFLKAIYIDDKEKVVSAINRCLVSHKPYEVEHRVKLKNGKINWLLEKGNVIRNREGKPIEMYGIVRDITEAKRNAEELRASREKYQLLAEAGQEVICLHSLQGDLLYTSPAIKSLLGYSPATLVGKKKSWDLCHAEDSGKLMELFARAVHNPNEAHTMLVRFKKKSGGYKWCEKSIKAVVDADGSIHSLRSLTRDVSYQIKYEEKLRETNTKLVQVNTKLLESQQRLAQIYEELKLKSDALNQMAIVVVSDDRGNIKEVNQQFLKITGYRSHEVIGKPHCILYASIFNSGVHPPQFFKSIWDTLTAGQVWRGEICNKAKSGKLFWLLKTIIPLQDEKGKTISFFSFSNDITIQKLREKELIEARQLAEEASAIKEDFLSVMSHEIRTPLNSVIGLSNLLLRRSPREDQTPIIKTLKSSSDNLMYLVNDILDYNKIRAGKIELEETNFSVLELCSQLQASFLPLAEEKGLILTIVTDPKLPDQLYGDVTRLTQIANNLINNAIKFTLEGNIKVVVSQKSLQDDRCELSFEVHDTGIGIPDDQLDKLFSPFHQADRDITRKFGGTGLGLSIVKGLIEFFGGEIAVKSRLGSGSVFSFWVPLKVKQRKARGTSKAGSIRSSLKGYRVLYVEDVESNRLLVKNILEDCEATCVVASNGKKALMLTKHYSFDVILMDLQMPVLNGYDVTQLIRHQKEGKNRRTRIIAFTAEPYSDALRSKTQAAGIKDIITKPFQHELLVQKIRAVQVSKPEKRNILSLIFYEKAFDFDKKQLSKVKKAIQRDFAKFELRFFNYSRSKNLDGMRKEIHTLSPIAKNLKCYPLLSLFDSYRSCESYSKEMLTLNKELKAVLKVVNTQLRKITY